MPVPTQDNTERPCDFCGYSLDGLPESSNCPECGGLSLGGPLRPGTPWQQTPSLLAWLKTVWLVHVKPGPLFRSAEPRLHAPLTGLLLLNATIVPVLVALGLLAAIIIADIYWPEQHDDSVSVDLIVVVLGMMFSGAIAGWTVLLCGVAGLATLLLQRNPRKAPIVDRNAWMIVVHASCVFAVAGPALLLLVGFGWERPASRIALYAGSIGCLLWFGCVCWKGARVVSGRS